MPPIGTLESARSPALSTTAPCGWRTGFPHRTLHVDASGRVVAGAAEWPVRLHRGGQPLAAVWLGTSDRDVHDLTELLGSSARLAIDSERMQAERQAQLRDLQASRQRIVATADSTRRRVERSIHDIVQAELLAALFDLARAHTHAVATGDCGRAHETAELADGIRALVANVRAFANGIYPAVLDASGLSAALDALADEAPVVLTVHRDIDRRVPVEIERAAYLLVHDGVTRAATDVTIAVGVDHENLSLTIEPYPGGIPEHLVDRVGALGGHVDVDAVVMKAVLPCA